ncbi:MAG TPA: hypothetical protein VMU33_07875 [Burkholderiaceae bacterium]|nr:hypothetical protein [Burkholderiaceae bacterium]
MSDTARQVSAGNPCPFLRALVAQGLLPDDTAPLGEVARVIDVVARAGDDPASLGEVAIRTIALIANGLGPGALLRNASQGLHLNQLRDGPLDKHGAGSRLLDAQARFDAAQWAHLEGFASEKTAADGSREPGLDLRELTRMMDANFERAAGHRRRVDRALMNGEWPILLKVLGKAGANGRYLSLAELRELVEHRRLPGRVMARLQGPVAAG